MFIMFAPPQQLELVLDSLTAAMFDLDGTLVDSLRDLAEAMNRVLSTAGLPVHPEQAYLKFIGNGMDKLVERALPPAERAPGRLEGHILAMKSDYADNWDRHTRPYPGIMSMLRDLAARGVHLTILSNKPHEYTVRFAQRYFGEFEFASVRGSLPQIPRKPDPYAALEIAREINLEPARFLYLGDSATDMQTAVSAGMFAVGAAWGFRSRSELLQSGARVLAEHPREVVDLFRTEARA